MKNKKRDSKKVRREIYMKEFDLNIENQIFNLESIKIVKYYMEDLILFGAFAPLEENNTSNSYNPYNF